MQSSDNKNSLLPWKFYLSTIIESLLAFYIASFCIAMFFTHRGINWLTEAIILIILYLFVIFVCSKRILEKLSLATIMLMIPLTPLIAIIIVISLIPLVQIFA